MPNLGDTIKQEIQRLARKEIKAQTAGQQRAIAQHRHEIAALKRQLEELEKKVGFLEAQETKRLSQSAGAEEPAEGTRFSARSVKSQRARLGLSAADYAKLVGVTLLTIYKWEQGKNRPHKKQLAALAALRGIGKKEALARLELLKTQGGE